MRKAHPILAGIESVKPYPTVTAHALYDVRPPLMQVEDFLAAGSILGITAYPGVGKTWLVLELTRAIASGTPFLGRFKAKRGGVLFVGSDSSTEDYARQWTRLTRMTPSAAIAFEPARFLLASPFLFEDREEIRRLIATHRAFAWGETYETEDGPARESGFRLMIFDTYSKMTRGNQNDNSETEENFRNIRWLAEATGAAIVILHHNAKRSEHNDGADWRGAMAGIGALDSWIQLTRSRRREAKNLINVQYKKFRGIQPADFSFQLNAGPEDEQASLVLWTDEPVTAVKTNAASPLAAAITEYLTEHPGATAPTMRDALFARFQDGVGSERYETPKKFNTGVNNRLRQMCLDGHVRKDLNAAGKVGYFLPDAKASSSEVPQHEVPASPQRGDTPQPGASSAPKSRKKGTTK